MIPCVVRMGTLEVVTGQLLPGMRSMEGFDSSVWEARVLISGR
jgi:hypothetical protein